MVRLEFLLLLLLVLLAWCWVKATYFQGHTRLPSLMKGAGDGFKNDDWPGSIFIMAAFLEGFVTRYSHTSLASLFILISSHLSFVFYLSHRLTKKSDSSICKS
jgi:hypothetical protein